MLPNLSAVRILRSDDPEAVRLLAAGAYVQGESWGARLAVTPAVLATCRAAVDAARGAGWTVRALVPQEAAALVELDAGAVPDYPRTAATSHDVPDAAGLALAAAGHTRFGTGGAGDNVGSRRANEALGYVVTERWLHLVAR